MSQTQIISLRPKLEIIFIDPYTLYTDPPSVHLWDGALSAANQSGEPSLNAKEQGKFTGADVATSQEKCQVLENPVKYDPICWWSGDHGGYSGADSSGTNGVKESNHGETLQNGSMQAGNAEETIRARQRGGISIFGGGCSRCTVGELCAFEIAVRPPAKWVPHKARLSQIAQGKKAWAMRHTGGGGGGSSSSGARIGMGGMLESLVVRLMGPALVIADVTTEDGDVTRWRVTYRVWDAGDY
ncbi:unnamed protein product, partial [Closterium sp. NIES-53]